MSYNVTILMFYCAVINTYIVLLIYNVNNNIIRLISVLLPLTNAYYKDFNIKRCHIYIWHYSSCHIYLQFRPDATWSIWLLLLVWGTYIWGLYFANLNANLKNKFMWSVSCFATLHVPDLLFPLFLFICPSLLFFLFRPCLRVANRV